MANIDNSEDILDVRDIIAQVEELRQERQDLQDNVDACEEAYKYHDSDDTKSTPEWHDLQDAYRELDNWRESDEASELASLESLLDDLKGYGGDEQWEGDWYPVTLIRDSYFTEAMQELVQDIGDLPKEIPSYLEIDWEKTAENLQVDYSSVEFDGVTYWYR